MIGEKKIELLRKKLNVLKFHFNPVVETVVGFDANGIKPTQELLLRSNSGILIVCVPVFNNHVRELLATLIIVYIRKIIIVLNFKYKISGFKYC